MNDSAARRKQAWLVCIACSMLFSAFFGFLNNCTALLLSAIADDMGFSNSQLSLNSTMKTIAYAVFISLSGKLYSGKDGKRWLLLSGSACILSYLAMPFYTKIWQLYISSAIFGCGSSGILILASLVLPNWFEKDLGKAMSTVIAPAGLIGMLFNPILSRVIASLGWRYGCVLLCVPAALLIFPAVLFMYKPFPDGFEAEKLTNKAEALSQSGRPSLGKGRVTLILCIVAAAGGVYYNKMQDFMVQVAAVSGYALSVRAVVASCLMFGNLFFKTVSGILVDRFGVFRSFRLWYALLFCSIVLMLIPVQSPFIIYASSFLFSASFGLNLIGLPNLLRQFFSGDEYNKKMRFIASLNYYVSAGLAFLVGKILDLSSGVRLLFSFWLVLAVVSFCSVPVLEKKRQAQLQLNT